MTSQFWHTFTTAIKDARAFAKLSTRQLGELIGVSKATISRVEHGNQPDADTFIKLCTWLNSAITPIPVDFDIDNITNHIIQTFAPAQEQVIYNVMSQVSNTVQSLKFDGTFTVKQQQYFYITVNGVEPILLTQICKRLQLYGQWQTALININNKPYPYNSNGICITKDDFNPTNIKPNYA